MANGNNAIDNKSILEAIKNGTAASLFFQCVKIHGDFHTLDKFDQVLENNPDVMLQKEDLDEICNSKTMKYFCEGYYCR